jgi:rapamycin-insensitive companion of mTOR
MAAMNLIIALSTNSATNRQLPPAILEALREIVKTHDDPCCRVALDALLQMAIQNPDHAAKYGVLTPLVEAIIDPYFKAMQESLVLFVLYLLDSADTRCYLTNLSYILAPLTGAHFPDQLEVTQLSIRTVTLMLKSWPGIIWAVSQGACQAMVTAMTSSDPKRSSLVIDALFEIFRTPNPGSSNPFQRQGVVVLQPHDLDVLMTSHDVTADAPDRSRSKRQNIMLNYLAVVLSGFIDAGLIEALIELGTDSTDDRIKVTVLLADVLELSNNLLSPSACTKLQQAPDLVKKAVSFRMDPQLRSSASTMITNLYKYSNTKNPLSQDIPITTLANATRSSKDHRLDRIDEVRRKIEWELDEAGLQQRLRQTNVLQYGNKDWARWKWDSISELIEGPLRNPVFLQATLKLKFFKRFLSFFRPSKKIFSELPWAYVRFSLLLDFL